MRKSFPIVAGSGPRHLGPDFELLVESDRSSRGRLLGRTVHFFILGSLIVAALPEVTYTFLARTPAFLSTDHQIPLRPLRSVVRSTSGLSSVSREPPDLSRSQSLHRPCIVQIRYTLQSKRWEQNMEDGLPLLADKYDEAKEDITSPDTTHTTAERIITVIL
jgi:hypothetical protein